MSSLGRVKFALLNLITTCYPQTFSDYVPNYLKFHTSGNRRRHLDALLFFLNVHNVKILPLPFGSCRPSCDDGNCRDLLCLLLSLNVATVLPLDGLRQPMPSAGIVVRSPEGLFC
jgi:hypothetical protein